VEPDKYEMVKDYYARQLQSLWNKPLLGCVPYMEAISLPTMSGFAELLHGNFVAGEANRSSLLWSSIAYVLFASL
jgi:hypothetical protein